MASRWSVSICAAELLLAAACSSSSAGDVSDGAASATDASVAANPFDGATTGEIPDGASVGEPDDGGPIDCKSFCAATADSTCADKPWSADECEADCEQTHGDSVAACEPYWNSLLACLERAIQKCMLAGACDAQDQRFSSCLDTQNPCQTSGSDNATNVNRTGFDIVIRDLRCGCPQELRTSTASACEVAADCAEYCCGCSPIQAGTAIALCLQGQCADQATACANGATEFGDITGTTCP